MSIYGALFRRVLFPAYESGLRRRKTLHHLAGYQRNEWLAPEQIRVLQWQKLKRLIDHCWNEVPWYRERWREIGATAADIRSMDDYACLPILTKQDIRENFDRLITPSLRNSLLYKTTGGSTGEPLRLAYTRENYEHRIACMFRGYAWTGARPGQRTLYLWGVNLHPTFWPALKERLQNAVFNRRMLNVFGMSESGMGDYAAAIDRYRPETIVSYVEPIVALSKWMIGHGIRVHRPDRILTAAEALHDYQRDLIEQAFGCPVYNTYGCREVMMIAGECEHRDGLHVNADHLVVELLGPDGAVADHGEVAVSDLSNYGMPFLRYVNGDMATRGSDAVCACGRGLPRLARIDGRKLDMIRTASGQTLPGEFFPHMLKDIPGVRQFQVVQRRLDEIQVSVVPGPEFGEAQAACIRDEIAKVIGTGTSVDIRLADEIPLTATGKLRVTVSELA